MAIDISLLEDIIGKISEVKREVTTLSPVPRKVPTDKILTPNILRRN
jgi:hypothetical protein